MPEGFKNYTEWGKKVWQWGSGGGKGLAKTRETTRALTKEALVARGAKLQAAKHWVRYYQNAINHKPRPLGGVQAPARLELAKKAVRLLQGD